MQEASGASDGDCDSGSKLTSHHHFFFRHELLFYSTKHEMDNTQEEEDIKLSFRDGISHFACVVPPPPSFLSARRPAPPDAAAAAARPQNRAKSKSKAQPLSSGALDGGGGGGAEDDANSSSKPRGRPAAGPVRSTASPNNRRSMRLEESRLKRASARSQKKPKRGYAAPEVYAHLGGVPDYVAEELDGMPPHPHTALYADRACPYTPCSAVLRDQVRWSLRPSLNMTVLNAKNDLFFVITLAPDI
jgi:hypothetical protein